MTEQASALVKALMDAALAKRDLTAPLRVACVLLIAAAEAESRLRYANKAMRAHYAGTVMFDGGEALLAEEEKLLGIARELAAAIAKEHTE